MENRVLKIISKSPEFSLYEAQSEIKNFSTFVISTPETRELTTNPFLVGKEYRDALKNSITKTLSQPEVKKIFHNFSDENLNVLSFLRGGLNFQILDALGECGKNNVRASFMSSERAKKQGNWIIQDNQYVKLNIADGSIIFIGDIVATGITLRVGLAELAKRYSNLKYESLPDFVKEYTSESNEGLKKQIAIKKIIMFTLGGEEAEKTLLQYHKLFKEIFPSYEETAVFFIEGIFHTANSETPAKIKIAGTDLLPYKAILAPEFEQELYKNPIKAVERCIVYDGGSRGFHPSHHLEDVLEYTLQIQEELSKGATMYDLILDRWQNAGSLSEEIKTKLKEPSLGKSWIKERKEKINSLIT